jgi:hypothetical protein
VEIGGGSGPPAAATPDLKPAPDVPGLRPPTWTPPPPRYYPTGFPDRSECSGRYVECIWRQWIADWMVAKPLCAAIGAAGGPVGIWKLRATCWASSKALQTVYFPNCEIELATCQNGVETN